MSNSNEEELHLSDEKMDTRSESFRSQDTPNSTLSSDYDDTEDQNASNIVLRLSEPETNDNIKTATSKLKQEFNDSLITKMSNLNINSPDNRPINLGISPPKFSSTLTLTTNHPLMGLGSPEKNYPDVIPKNLEDKDLSLSSIEDDRPNETNGFDMYSPERNTSKNNLYFSELFTTADSQILNDSTLPPDVAKVNQRRKIALQLETPNKDTSKPQRILNLKLEGFRDGNAKDMYRQSTPKVNGAMNIPGPDEIHSGVAEWCESPSHLRRMPNFELPIEMSSSISLNKALESPDVISTSTQDDKSAYQALLDPYTGSVALRPRPASSPETSRRKIQLPPEDDACSLASVSECSMESDGEDVVEMDAAADASNDDVRRSASSNTISACSESIAEYSLADELRDERGWVTVARGAGGGGRADCDMKVIEPYKRVLSHGGYDARGAAIIVFSACHLPDTARTDYTYVMDNLFLYVIWTLDRLVTDEYNLVYLHGSASRRKLPTFTWLHECYKLIDKRLRKSLKHLYLVHPTFWLKSFVLITKPFVSSKFFRKLSYVRSLSDLMDKLPIEPNAIPELVKNYDATR